MQHQIWSVLTQILCHRNDLTNILKPLFENLKNENINDDKNIPFLKSLSIFQLNTLYECKIITKAKLSSLLSKKKLRTKKIRVDIIPKKIKKKN